LSYGLLAVASLRSKVIPYPPPPFFLNPPTLRTFKMACSSTGAQHAVYHRANVRQILKFMDE